MGEVEKDVNVWGRDIERRRAWLLHRSTFAIGPVHRFFTGEGGNVYLSAIDHQPVTAPVVLLETGHALLAKPDAFIEINSEEANFYIETIDKLRRTIIESVQHAAMSIHARSSVPDLPMALILSALRSQVHALEATTAIVAGPPPEPSTKTEVADDAPPSSRE